MRIHMIRHGEVDNPRHVVYERLPGYHLSHRGQAMARAVAKFVATAPDMATVGALYSSPLERAQETAHPIADKLDLPIVTDDRLIEAGNEFRGTRPGQGEGSLFRHGHFALLRNPFRPSWGEPYAHIAERMTSAVADIRHAEAGHDVVVVSHQTPIWVLRLALEGRHLWHSPSSRRCALASMTTFEFDGDSLVSVLYRQPAAQL